MKEWQALEHWEEKSVLQNKKNNQGFGMLSVFKLRKIKNEESSLVGGCSIIII